eukprot:SAG11_NODE_34714_length_270_cov_0.994152_1_plen_40_part_10
MLPVSVWRTFALPRVTFLVASEVNSMEELGRECTSHPLLL